jgi:hypothetical protein
MRMCALAGAGAGLSWAQRALAMPGEAQSAGQSDQPAETSQIFLPFVSTVNPPPYPGRVIHVHSNQATNWTGQPRWWEHILPEKIDAMVDQGIIALTGLANLVNAWRALLPNYQPGQKIAIKVNLNNSHSCTDADTQIDASIQPVNAVVRGLKLLGVAENDICVYDAARYMPEHLVAGCAYPGVKFFGQGGCSLPSTFDSTAPGSTIQFNPPPGAPNPGVIKVSDVLVNAAYVINMPIMKNHVLAGVTLGFKNHFGSTNNPSGMHANTSLNSAGYRSDYSALVDLYNNPHIGAKTILTLADGLFASKTNQSGSPSVWNSFGGNLPNSLFFSTDPVAVDCVMCDFLAAEVSLTPKHDDYLKLASQAGLGVFERGDPRGSGYQVIDYRYFEG